jgi:AbrB family looped-hinge helix DNA binding protein
MTNLTAQIGKRGTLVIPAALRHKYGMEEGSQVMVEAHNEGLLLRPVVTLPVEIYSPEKRAGILLNNAVTRSDYEKAVKAVVKMGLDPETIPHKRPW